MVVNYPHMHMRQIVKYSNLHAVYTKKEPSIQIPQVIMKCR